MIRKYIDEALRRAKYELLEDGSYYAEIAELPGILATGSTVEECRTQLDETIEEWLLVRVARGLAIPQIGNVKVEVREAG